MPLPLLLLLLPTCKQYDTSEDGTIDFDEFLEMAKVLVGSRTNFTDSLPWKYGSGELTPTQGTSFRARLCGVFLFCCSQALA